MSRAWPVDGLDPDGPVLANARRILAVRIAEYYAFAPIVAHPELASELHDLRIAAKRLRYTMELFRAQLGKVGERQIERARAVQEALGTLHDHDVRIALIGDELSRVTAEQCRVIQAAIARASETELPAIAAAALRPPPDDPRRGLIALLGREHAARRAAYQAFLDLWRQHAAEGMREELVALSALPLSEAGERRAA
jgi:hypothetical protein